MARLYKLQENSAKTIYINRDKQTYLVLFIVNFLADEKYSITCRVLKESGEEKTHTAEVSDFFASLNDIKFLHGMFDITMGN